MVSKCEQQVALFRRILPLTWRLGALCSISERADILPSVRLLKGSPMRGVLRVFLADQGRPPRHVTPRKSCDQSQNVERWVQIANTASRQRRYFYSGQGSVPDDRLL